MVGRPRTVSDEAILDAAVALIGEVGPHALTLQAVAGAVGLAAPTLVQRFGSKRGLLVAVARRGVDTHPTFHDARRKAPTRLGAVVQALTSMVAGIRSPAVLANHLSFLQMDLTDAELGDLAARQSRSMRREIEALLDAAAAEGELGRSTDTAALARAVYVAYNGSLLAWALDGRGGIGPWLAEDLAAVVEPYRSGTPLGRSTGPHGPEGPSDVTDGAGAGGS